MMTAKEKTSAAWLDLPSRSTSGANQRGLVVRLVIADSPSPRRRAKPKSPICGNKGQEGEEFVLQGELITLRLGKSQQTLPSLRRRAKPKSQICEAGGAREMSRICWHKGGSANRQARVGVIQGPHGIQNVAAKAPEW